MKNDYVKTILSLLVLLLLPSLLRADEHPYLYVNGDDLPALRERLTHEPFLTKWNTFISKADYICTLPVTTGDFGSRTRNGLGYIGIPSFAYLITENPVYFQRAKDEVWGFINTTPWQESDPGLGSAEIALGMALFYDWCYDALTEAERSEFRDAVYQRLISPYFDCCRGWRGYIWWTDNYVSNWCGVMHGGFGLLALSLYDDYTVAQTCVDTYAWPKVQTFINGMTEMDGAGHEGVMYDIYGKTFAHYLASSMDMYRNDDSGIYTSMTGKLTGYWNVYMQAPSLLYANFNDMGETVFGYFPPTYPEGGPNASLCALLEAYTPGGDPLLKWGAEVGGEQFWWHSVAPFWFLWHRDAPNEAKPVMQDSVLFRGVGQSIWNTSSYWLAVNCGWTSNASHYNMDLGTFILESGGERYINDPGYGDIDTGDHSTVVINGGNQLRNVSGTWLYFGEDTGFRYMAADLAAVYGTPVTRCTRHFIDIDETYLIIADDVETSTAANVESRFQSTGTVAVVPAQQRGTVSRSGDLHVVCAQPSGAVVSSGTSAIDFISIGPAASVTEEFIITILYPGALSSSPPTASFDDGTGTLTVNRPGGGTDTAVFSRLGDGTYVLDSVNGVSTSSISDGSTRTITPFRASSAVDIVYPKGDEDWDSFSTHTVRWTSTSDVGNVNIDLSTDNGATWSPLASNIANDGRETITMPGGDSAQCLLRVRETDGSPECVIPQLFTLSPLPVETPVISPTGGAFGGSVSVSITCATSGVEIRYTTDGTDPTGSSALYTAPFDINSDTTVRAYAIGTGFIDSAVAQQIYTVSPFRDPENPAAPVPGLTWSCYEQTFTAIPDFSAEIPETWGLTGTYDLSVSEPAAEYGLRFLGYISVPAQDNYTFYITSDDGADFWIGNQCVADNDGVHGSTEASGSIPLKAGLHRITIGYFTADAVEELLLEWTSGGFARTAVLPGDLFTDAPADADSDGDGLSDEWEETYNYNPHTDDTDNDGTTDDQEDPDKDGDVNLDEFLNGTNPLPRPKKSSGGCSPAEEGDGCPWLLLMIISFSVIQMRSRKKVL